MLSFIKMSPKIFTYIVLFSATIFYSQTAHAGKCPGSCDRGALCFNDLAASDIGGEIACGKFHGSNDYWSTWGWNNRADQFQNNGYGSYKVCLYDATRARGTTLRVVYPGRTVHDGPRDRVSSNKWVKLNSFCPK